MLRRQRTIQTPDVTVRRWIENFRVDDVPLGRNHGLITLSDTDSCLEALRVLLERHISSAPVVMKVTKENTKSETVLGFVDVLDLVTLMINSHTNTGTSVLDGLVSDIRHAVNLSGSNKLVTVRRTCTVAECLPLLVGGVKRLAVVDEENGDLISVLTQSETLRWIISKVNQEKEVKEEKEEKVKEENGGKKSKKTNDTIDTKATEETKKKEDDQIGRSAISQKLNMSIDELNLTPLSINENQLLVIRSEQKVASAFMLLANHRLSAAPIVNAQGAIVGVFSASDVRKMPSIKETTVTNQDSDEIDAHHGEIWESKNNDVGVGNAAEQPTNQTNQTEKSRNRKVRLRHSSALRVVQAFASLNKLDMKVSEYKQSSSSITVTSKDTLNHVCNLLSTHSIHRVYIVDVNNVPYGVVSIADVLHALVAPNVPFDAMCCNASKLRLEQKLIMHLPKTTCLLTLVRKNEVKEVYVNDPMSPDCCIAVIGHSIRHGNREVAARVLDLSKRAESSENSENSGENGLLLNEELSLGSEVARSIAFLSKFVVRRNSFNESSGGSSGGGGGGGGGSSVMWCGLDQSIWTIIQRTMHVHGFRRTTLERCQLYYKPPSSTTIAPIAAIAPIASIASIDISEDTNQPAYIYRPLSLSDATTVNDAWKYKCESSLQKIQQLITKGITMAAYKNGKNNIAAAPPVCWMVTYENGSIGMLHTVK